MIKFTLPVFLSIAFLVSCGHPEDVVVPSLDIEEYSVDFAASGNVPASVTVRAVGVEWECRVPESYGWITASKTDDRTFTLSVADNDTQKGSSG